nr:hypothetical protein [Tanacetum cinerariifolium]
MENQEQNPLQQEQPFVTAKQVGFNLEDIILNRNNEVALLYPKHNNKDNFNSVFDFISKWVNTFRNSIGAHYLPHSSEYVAPSCINIVRLWFKTNGYGEVVPSKWTLEKSLLPLSWREATKGGSSKVPTSSKTSHSKKRVQSSSAMEPNPSQPLVFTLVDTGMHKEDQQATSGPNSLGVTRNDASVAFTTEADPGKTAPRKEASSIARQVEEEEASNTIKLEDLAKLVEHRRMILKSVEHGPLIWPTIEENGMTETKKYEELSATEKIQADCDLKETNIILQGLPSDVYSLINHHRVAKDLWEKVQLLMQDPRVAEGPVTQTVITHNTSYQTNDLDAYDSDCDDFSITKAVLMANLSSYGSDVLFEVNKDNLIANESLFTELERYKEQKIRPMLYDGSVIAKETNVISIAHSEETLMLREESRFKMLLKQSDPMVLEKKVNIKPINYAELNRLSGDFSKHFVPQQELSDEHAFRLQTLHPDTDQSASSSLKIEAPRELPKISLVNTSLQKFKYHLGQFDNVVRKWITPNALTKEESGFEHTKAVFLKEIIPFSNTLKDIFNVYDEDF